MIRNLPCHGVLSGFGPQMGHASYIGYSIVQLSIDLLRIRRRSGDFGRDAAVCDS